MNSKIWLVVRREYMSHVAKRSFWIGLLLGPLFFAGIFALQILSYRMAPEIQKTVIVVDRSGQVAAEVAGDLDRHMLKKVDKPEFVVQPEPPMADSTAQAATLNKRVAAREIFGYLIVDQNVDDKGAFRFYTRNVGNSQSIDKIEEAVNHAMVGLRLKSRNVGLSRDQLRDITQAVHLSTFKVTQEGKAQKRDFTGVYIASFAFIMILIMTILGYGVTALRSILEEKSSRIIEVLLSSMTPFELMMGKIVGTVLVGLTQVVAYVMSGVALSAFGISSTSPEILKSVVGAFTPATLGFFVIYYLLGIFLFMALFTAIGSMVNSEQEAQHMQQPIIWLLIIPLYATFFFVNNPDSTLARVVSLIPFFTPVIMMVRICVLTPPWWEIGLSIVLTLGAIFLVTWAAARVFRIGILMYGKRPNLPEIFRWIKSS